MNQYPFSLTKQLTPTRETSLPYLEELHQRYGLEVYPEDPFVGVFHIRDNVWAMYAPCTHAVGDNWLYLIEGPEKALFIDNGYGIGDLRALGEKLTGKPVISAVTHYHGDHAGGKDRGVRFCDVRSRIYRFSRPNRDRCVCRTESGDRKSRWV